MGKAGRQKSVAVHSRGEACVTCVGIQKGFPEEEILDQKADPIGGLPQANHKERGRQCSEA